MSSTPAQTIRQIDRHIDGVTLELFRRGGRFNIFDAGAWQLAFDRHPDLGARRDTLFRLRGLAQLDRDAQAERDYRAAQRKQRRAYRTAA
jgi:hypothetical protein